MAAGPERAVRAQACLGTRFRPHGRVPGDGLDCVGVAAWAFRRTVAGRYPLRGGSVTQVTARIAALALVPTLRPGEGDLALVDGGLGQLHLVVLTAAGFVHADARLRRVVEVPGRPAGVISYWTEGRSWPRWF